MASDIPYFSFDTSRAFADLRLEKPDLVALENWIDQLPKANLNKSLWLVYNAIVSLHEHSMDPKQWFKSLELFHPLVHYLATAQRYRYLDEPLMSLPTKQALMQKTQLLQMEFVKAYTQLILSPDRKKLSNLEQATCVHRAMRHLSHILLFCAQMYFPVPAGLWQKFYELYNFACRAKLTAQLVVDQEFSSGEATTINNVFKIPLLLMSCCVHQLHRQDIEKIFNSLSSWAKLVQIHEKVEADDRYVFCISSDQAPVYQELKSEQHPESDWRGLNLSLLVEHLTALMEQLDHGKVEALKSLSSADQDYSHHLLQQLVRVLGSFPQRAFQRIPRIGKLKISLGLSATHYFLSEGLEVMPDLCNSVVEMSKHKMNYKMQDGQIINSSTTGYCLCMTADLYDLMQVGEIVGLKEDNHWYVGSIRWLKYIETNQLQTGIQLLSSKSIPIGVRNRQQQEHESDYLRALLLINEDGTKERSTLVMPFLPYQAGDELRVVNESLDTDVVLKECVDQGLHYRQFTFEVIKHYANPF